jgi:hypothetical protein
MKECSWVADILSTNGRLRTLYFDCFNKEKNNA